MILRRLADALRRQDWATVVLEVLIVVLGVFLGIQVANWNEEMADRRLGEDYRLRLIADLETDLAALKGMETYYREVLDSVRDAIRLLGQPSPDARSLVKATYRASEINYDPQTRATWDQIVSSGHIGLIPTAAAARLAEYFAFDFLREANDQLYDSEYRERVRRMIPLPVQEAIREGCSDVRLETAVIVGFTENCVIDVDEAMLDRVAQTLRADPGLIASLNWHYSHAYSAAINSSGLAIQVQRALDALEPAGRSPDAPDPHR
ncbi:MAG: hypothetical protein R3323_02140 [Wenzhouxiangellaceae bacterium]|nr:hypothetical protein [Wenzhouxiangellaceae bacterium]